MRGYFRKHEFDTFLKRFPFEGRVYHLLSDMYAQIYDGGETDDICRRYLKPEVVKEKADRVFMSLSSVRCSEDLRIFLKTYGESLHGFEKHRVGEAVKAIGKKSAKRVDQTCATYRVPDDIRKIVTVAARDGEFLASGTVIPGMSEEEHRRNAVALSIRCGEDLDMFLQTNGYPSKVGQSVTWCSERFGRFIDGFGFSKGVSGRLCGYFEEVYAGRGDDPICSVCDAESLAEFLKLLADGKIVIGRIGPGSVQKMLKSMTDQMKEPAWLKKQEDILPVLASEPEEKPADILPVLSEEDTVERLLDACMLIGAVADDLKTFAESVKRCSEDIRAACELMQSANESKK